MDSGKEREEATEAKITNVRAGAPFGRLKWNVLVKKETWRPLVDAALILRWGLFGAYLSYPAVYNCPLVQPSNPAWYGWSHKKEGNPQTIVSEHPCIKVISSLWSFSAVTVEWSSCVCFGSQLLDLWNGGSGGDLSCSIQEPSHLNCGD